MSTQASQPSPAPKQRKGRSPSYPGISLPKAITRARKVYDHAQGHQLPLKNITALWGYKSPTTGPATVTYAALKKFGLLEEQGTGDQRVGWVTELAEEILHPSSPNQADAIKRAALNPPVHQEWWNQYRLSIPPFETLEWQLVTKGPWTETGLRDFIHEYTETMRFAKLDSTDAAGRGTADDQGDEHEGEESGEDARPGVGQVHEDSGAAYPGERVATRHAEEGRSRRNRLRSERVPGVKTYAIPVDADNDAVIELPTPMTPARWENFKAFLDAMERVIVDHAADHRPEDGAEDSLD